jgi:hypothetical protein
MSKEPKTKLNQASVTKFLNSIDDANRREDSFAVLEIMQAITKQEAKMWGKAIVGFGTYHYVYASGREGNWMQVGFSPRKNALSLYIMSGFSNYSELMEKLGKYKTGKSCLYIKKLEDVDIKILKKLIRESTKYIKKTYP